MQLRGSLDRVDSEFIEGWITCAEAPDLKVVLEVWLGGNLLGHAAADRFRADLAESDIGDGHCAFSFKLPSFIPDSQLNEIKLKLVNTDFLWLRKNCRPSRRRRMGLRSPLRAALAACGSTARTGSTGLRRRFAPA